MAIKKYGNREWKKEKRVPAEGQSGGRRYRIMKEPALSDFHTNSRTAGNHSKIKVIHHPRGPFYSATLLNSIPLSDGISPHVLPRLLCFSARRG